MSSTEVAVRDGGGAVEKGEAHERRMAALYRDCATLSKSELVPKALRGKPDNVFALALYGEQYGLSPIHSAQRIYLIEGSFEPKAEVLGGVVMRAGHELRWDETSSERCTVSIRRDRSQDWQSTTWTLDDARRAGLLDMWVEKRTQDGTWPNGDKKWKTDKAVVGDDGGVFTDEERRRRALGPLPDWAREKLDAGDVKRKDPWFQFPGDMLAAKCLRRAAKRITPDALLGIDVDMPFEPMTPEKVAATASSAPTPATAPDGGEERPEPSTVAERDDEGIEDAELVDVDEQPREPHDAAPPPTDIAPAEAIDVLIDAMNLVPDADARSTLKGAFVDRFGAPGALPLSMLDEASEWVEKRTQGFQPDGDETAAQRNERERKVHERAAMDEARSALNNAGQS